VTYYGYILQSEKTGRYYTGQTNNLEERLKQHNGGEERSTKSDGPWKLVYQKEFTMRSEAVLWERSVKARKKRRFLEKLIQEYVSGRGAAR
jgi:putative endonuclease